MNTSSCQDLQQSLYRIQSGVEKISEFHNILKSSRSEASNLHSSDRMRYLEQEKNKLQDIVSALTDENKKLNQILSQSDRDTDSKRCRRCSDSVKKLKDYESELVELRHELRNTEALLRESNNDKLTL